MKPSAWLYLAGSVLTAAGILTELAERRHHKAELRRMESAAWVGAAAKKIPDES
jgi:hypothetical protein